VQYLETGIELHYAIPWRCRGCAAIPASPAPSLCGPLRTRDDGRQGSHAGPIPQCLAL